MRNLVIYVVTLWEAPTLLEWKITSYILDAQKNVKICDKIPPKVMEEMRALLVGNTEKKKQKHAFDVRCNDSQNSE